MFLLSVIMYTEYISFDRDRCAEYVRDFFRICPESFKRVKATGKYVIFSLISKDHLVNKFGTYPESNVCFTLNMCLFIMYDQILSAHAPDFRPYTTNETITIISVIHMTDV